MSSTSSARCVTRAIATAISSLVLPGNAPSAKTASDISFSMLDSSMTDVAGTRSDHAARQFGFVAQALHLTTSHRSLLRSRLRDRCRELGAP
jgi:hypothetical protein